MVEGVAQRNQHHIIAMHQAEKSLLRPFRGPLVAFMCSISPVKGLNNRVLYHMDSALLPSMTVGRRLDAAPRFQLFQRTICHLFSSQTQKEHTR